MLKGFVVFILSTWLVSCSTSSYTERTDTHTVTVEIDTSVVIEIPIVVDTLATTETVSEDWVYWVSEEVKDGQPAFKAARNQKTGQTTFAVKPDSQEVKVRGSKTTTDSHQEKNKETKSLLSDLKPVLAWGAGTLVALALILIIVRKYYVP